MFATLKELALAALVAITCRYGTTIEKYRGYLEVSTLGPLRFDDYVLGNTSLALRIRERVWLLFAK